MTVYRYLYASVAVLLVTVMFSACSPDKELHMDRLERALIHTWIANTTGEWPTAEARGNEAHKLWQSMRQDVPQSLLSPSEKQSLTKINLWMNNLKFALAYRQPRKVETALALMRNELMAIRPQYLEHHAADELYLFHEYWAEVVATTHDPMMCLLEWKEYEELVEQAVNQWAVYERSRPHFEDGLFPGYVNNGNLVEERKIALERALAAFQADLSQANHCLMADPSRQIETLYFEYLMAATNYPAPVLRLRSATTTPAR